MAILTYSQAIRRTIEQEMKRDERVFVMGEDVEKLGGVYGCTRDLYKEFGTERIRNTPITETAIIGSAIAIRQRFVLPPIKSIFVGINSLSFP